MEPQQPLQQSEQELIPCAVNSQHVHHNSLDSCPWCALASQQGRDPFPSVEAVQGPSVRVLEQELRSERDPERRV